MSGYIGTQPVPQATQTRDSFTATSGQTSFATGGYTPNFLDVYLNGVKLAAADYTASNGSDIVLASGAATGDILEVVAYTAFDTANVTGATNFTVTGAFTSQGIDDNANATAITIDASENVGIGTSSPAALIDLKHNSASTHLRLTESTSGNWSALGVDTSDNLRFYTNNDERMRIHASGDVTIGKTVSGNTLAGIKLDSTGYASFTATNDYPIIANRLSSDGDIAHFRKDGSTVGSIGVTAADNLYVAGSASNHAGLVFNNTAMGAWVNGAESDTTMSLGTFANRFRDLYLSDGVYLGGTGAANKLDDFETGTWTPTLQNAPSGISHAGTAIHNKYIKVGNLVTISGYVELNTTSPNSGNAFLVDGIPFAPNVTNAIAGSMICRYGSTDVYSPYMGNSSRIEWYKINNAGNWNLMTYADLNGLFSVHFTVSYTA